MENDIIKAVEVYSGFVPHVYAKVNGEVRELPRRGTWFGRKIHIVARMMKKLDSQYVTWYGNHGSYDLTPDEIAVLPDNTLPEKEVLQ